MILLMAFKCTIEIRVTFKKYMKLHIIIGLIVFRVTELNSDMFASRPKVWG